jgi:hypothetical protein
VSRVRLQHPVICFDAPDPEPRIARAVGTLARRYLSRSRQRLAHCGAMRASAIHADGGLNRPGSEKRGTSPHNPIRPMVTLSVATVLMERWLIPGATWFVGSGPK